MKHTHSNTWKTVAAKGLTGVVILGGALYGFTLSPAGAQDTPPAVGLQDDLRPVDGDVTVDPDGRLPRRDDARRPRPERDSEDGPDADGPSRGPRDEQGPRGRRGEMERGPHGRPVDMERGPGGPRGHRGGAEGREDGPGKDGPGRGARGPEGAMERAYRNAAELERYGKLEGDVFNLTGQARDFYNRAGVSLKAGKAEESDQLARTSQQLAEAALHLARAEKGPLAAPKVAGWDAPPTAKLPVRPVDADRGDMDRGEKGPRFLDDLQRRLQDGTPKEANASWVETARRLATQAKQDIDANRLDAGRERAMAAMNLLDAAGVRGGRQGEDGPGRQEGPGRRGGPGRHEIADSHDGPGRRGGPDGRHGHDEAMADGPDGPGAPRPL